MSANPDPVSAFRERYPEGSLQPANLAQPFGVVEVAGRVFVVHVAAAYRTPTDPRPAIGVAWVQAPADRPGAEFEFVERAGQLRAVEACLAGGPIVLAGDLAAPAREADQPPGELDARRMRAEQATATATRNRRRGAAASPAEPVGERRVRDVLRGRLGGAEVLKALNRQTPMFRGLDVAEFLDLGESAAARVEAFLDAGLMVEASGGAA
jgi:hypothetical protein